MSFGSQFVSNTVYRVLGIATNILIVLLLTRLLSVSDYGVLSLLIANVSIFNLVSCLGSESGIAYHYASGNIQRGKIFTIVYLVLLLQLVTLIGFETAWHYFTGKYWLIGTAGMESLLWGTGYLLAIAVIDKYTALLNAAHKYLLSNKTTLFFNLAVCMIYAYLFISNDVSKDGFFIIQLFIGAAICQALTLIILFHSFSSEKLSFRKATGADWKLFFSYSLIVFITNIIQFFAYRVDYWLIDHYHDSYELGLYSLAVRLGQLVWVLPLLFASIIFPQVADKEKMVDEEKIFSLIRVVMTGLFFAVAIAGLVSYWAIPLLAGEAFRPSVPSFLYMLPGLFFFCITIMSAAYFSAKGKLVINLLGSVLCFVVVLVLDLLLIPENGSTGAAIASSIAYFASGLYSVGRLTGFNKEKLSALLLFKQNDLQIVKRIMKKYLSSNN